MPEKVLPVTVTDKTFEQEILHSDLPALVDFWASWCAPCKMVGPMIEELAEEYKGRLKVAKLNVDENVDTPARYGIRGIPALLLFKNGELVDQIVGAVSKSTLVQFIEKGIG
jgi:thioredoxin 1